MYLFIVDHWYWIGLTDEVVEGLWALYPSEEAATYFGMYDILL